MATTATKTHITASALVNTTVTDTRGDLLVTEQEPPPMPS